MDLRIHISADIVGSAHAYSEKGRRGRRSTIPAYRMTVRGGGTQEFAVTRDTASGTNGEAPVHLPGMPYRGIVREDGELGFRIQLFEDRFGDKKTLQGTGSSPRTYIQIHKGPGKSDGCFLIAGGAREHARFKKIVRSLLGKDDSGDIAVEIEPRRSPDWKKSER